jgi:NAD(P)-dependent dehydrogenase (short-subunit alcohol dehydrogenase family)
MKIAIIGGGGLTNAFVDKYSEYQCTVFERSQYDIAEQSQCDQLIDQLVGFDAVIISAGTMVPDTWRMWLVNTVAPSYILEKLFEKKYQNRIVMVSSNAGNWSSWPDITFHRLVYNNTKHAISLFVSGADQGGLLKNCVVVEPSRFKTSMSGYLGQDVDDVAEAVNLALTNQLGIKTVVISKKSV